MKQLLAGVFGQVLWITENRLLDHIFFKCSIKLQLLQQRKPFNKLAALLIPARLESNKIAVKLQIIHRCLHILFWKCFFFWCQLQMYRVKLKVYIVVHCSDLNLLRSSSFSLALMRSAPLGPPSPLLSHSILLLGLGLILLHPLVCQTVLQSPSLQCSEPCLVS